MAHGDHIFVHRIGYTHHGIDTGDGTVIHYTGEVRQKVDAFVRRTSLSDFANGAEINVRHYATCDSADKVVIRAETRLDEANYKLASNNCEHFAVWCKTGKPYSEQVDDAKAAGGGFAGVGTTIAGAIGVISASGAAVGLSGPGIMSGLAYIGGLVGGGAVAGIALVGAAPAGISAAAMNYVLKDDPNHHEGERDARHAGRISSIIGATAGSAGSLASVALAGTAGVSGAGITSGLAAVGSVIGGGMVSGVVITAAGPAVAAVAVGYGAYRLHKYFQSKPPVPEANEVIVEDAMGEKKQDQDDDEHKRARGS